MRALILRAAFAAFLLLPTNARELALDWLEKAYDNRESPMERIGVFWDWQNLHAESRFQDLLRR
jgi:hypothetical protein